MTGFWDGSGISWTTCKQSAPRSRQITTPTTHHSIFTGQLLLLRPNQQCQSTEGRKVLKKSAKTTETPTSPTGENMPILPHNENTHASLDQE